MADQYFYFVDYESPRPLVYRASIGTDVVVEVAIAPGVWKRTQRTVIDLGMHARAISKERARELLGDGGVVS